MINHTKIQIFNHDNTLNHTYNGGGASNFINGLDWNAHGNALAFIENRRGLVVYNLTTNTYVNFFSTSFNQNLISVDWSPNNKFIAFSVIDDQTFVLETMSRTIVSSYSLIGNV